MVGTIAWLFCEAISVATCRWWGRTMKRIWWLVWLYRTARIEEGIWIPTFPWKPRSKLGTEGQRQFEENQIEWELVCLFCNCLSSHGGRNQIEFSSVKRRVENDNEKEFLQKRHDWWRWQFGQRVDCIMSFWASRYFHLKKLKTWTLREEYLLIEGIQEYGVGEWERVRRDYLPDWVDVI